MKKELLESYESIRKIRQEIPSKVKHQDTRDYLELIIKNNFLEAQNVQLLLNLQLQARTISQLKSMIFRQQQFIQENHLDSGESKCFKILGIARVFNDKQFDELEDDEDYKRLLVASPELGSEGRKKPGMKIDNNDDQEDDQEPIAPPVKELVGLISRERTHFEDNEADAFPSQSEDQNEGNNGKLPKGEELKEISITGVSAFKLEGKGVQSFLEKKPIPTKPKVAKETKKTAPVAQPHLF